MPAPEDLLRAALEQLMVETVKVVRERLKGDEVSPSDIKNALTLLKDNSIVLPPKIKPTPLQLGDLTEDLLELPFTDAVLDDPEA